MRNRRTLPSRQGTYIRLRAGLDEDAISHFYNVINDLSRRVSTLEKKLKPLRILVAVVTGNLLHEHHDPAPQGRIINSHERSDQP
jgi:hypothetical protein